MKYRTEIFPASKRAVTQIWTQIWTGTEAKDKSGQTHKRAQNDACPGRAAAIEQNHDAAGIIWPAGIAPFQVALLPLNAHKSFRVREAADALYLELKSASIDVLLDDRDERPGVKFADMELIGIPHRIVISERGLAEGKFEYKGRRDDSSRMIECAQISGLVRVG